MIRLHGELMPVPVTRKEQQETEKTWPLNRHEDDDRLEKLRA